MSAIRVKASVRNTMLDVLADAVDAGSGHGTIKLYTGTQATNADTALGSQTLLATFTCEDPAFGSASAGAVVLDCTPALSATAGASGTASWARVQDSDANVVFDGSVGASGSGADFIITSTTVVNGQTITLTAGQINFPAV